MLLYYGCLGVVRLNPLTSAATDADMVISVKWLKHAAVHDGDRMVQEQRKRNAKREYKSHGIGEALHSIWNSVTCVSAGSKAWVWDVHEHLRLSENTLQSTFIASMCMVCFWFFKFAL